MHKKGPSAKTFPPLPARRLRSGNVLTKGRSKLRGIAIPGFKHIKTVRDASELELLENGLRVVYMHIPGSGTVTSNLVYLVGSRHEIAGQTGLAHMLEHMLFKPVHDGTGKRLSEVGHKTLEDAGAFMNATTSLDRTNYFFMAPSAYFEKALEVEVGRMRNLIFDEKEFLPERANVVSEYEMYAGEPLDAVMTEIMQAAYVSHGYGHETIGHKPDIETMDLGNLHVFYDTYYWPNNAVLTIVGDISLESALRAVRNIFGAIPRSPHSIPAMKIVEPPQEGERRVSVERKNPINIYAESYKVPPTPSYVWAVLSVIGAYLSEGPQSRLDDALIDTHKASSAECIFFPTHDDGLFTIAVQIANGSTHGEVETVIRREIELLQNKPIDKKRLDTLKTMVRADLLYSRDGTYKITQALTEYIASGDWTRFYTLPDDIENVTVRDIQEAIQKYFRKNNRTIGTFVSQK